MTDKIILKSVEEYVKDLFDKKSPDENIYHNFDHTKDVVESAKEIGEAEGLNDEEMEMVQIACWFHDTGYFHCSSGHESMSSNYAREFLNKANYDPNKIESIVSCIESTKIPQSPKNKMEEVVCDADLSHLGRDDIKMKSDTLKREIEKRENKTLSDQEWAECSIDFLNKHRFFTKFAIREYGIKKELHKIKLEKRVKKLKKKSLKNKNLNEMESESTEEVKSTFDKNVGRGTETMFRNAIRTHVEFSSMADSKANIMISVNTIVLTIVIGFLIRKLDTNPHFIIPTLLITVTSLLTLIYAILVTRPKITSGTFSREDITNKNANLLFFGNFYKMSLEDFKWGMKSMIEDKEFLYDSMIRDFYYLGNVLGIKFKHLRICYNIFMVGMILSVLGFIIAFAMYPTETDLQNLLE